MKLIKNFVNQILEGKKTAQETSHLEHQIDVMVYHLSHQVFILIGVR